MVKRVIAGIGIGTVLAATLVLSHSFGDSIYITVLFCLIMLIGTIEVKNAAKNMSQGLSILIYLYAAAFVALNILCTNLDFLAFLFPYLPVLMLAVFTVLGAIVAIIAELNVSRLSIYCFVLIYPAMLVSPILLLNEINGVNVLAVSLILLISTFTDMFAYFFGILFGRRRLTSISPKKTVEGAVGGLAGGILGALCLYSAVALTDIFADSVGARILNSAWFYIAIGLVGSFFTQIGDLFASLIKRHFEIKDYSKLLFSHGGVMDRFDGIIVNGCFIASVFLFLSNVT